MESLFLIHFIFETQVSVLLISLSIYIDHYILFMLFVVFYIKYGLKHCILSSVYFDTLQINVLLCNPY